jgi:3-dehydroquinate dehydratase
MSRGKPITTDNIEEIITPIVTKIVTQIVTEVVAEATTLILTTMEKRFDALEMRFDRLEGRVHTAETCLDDHEVRLRSLEAGTA